MFCIGDFVIKPNTGICVIEDITYIDLGGGEKQYYVLQPKYDARSKLYVSTDVDTKRLRLAMDEETAMAFIKGIEDIEEAGIENDKLREQSYKDALLSNDPSDLVSIIKNMYRRGQERLAQGKKFTATDERYFQQAENILYSELGHALGVEKKEVKEIITETLTNV